MNRPMRLTADHLRLVHREMTDPGPIPGYSPMTDADYGALTEEFLAGRPPGPIPIFTMAP
ncbi:MAG: hypothetical protein FJX63_07675 [Alphaproteobacteria bacterium]|nr:hypothetical protein [Alphaproteobacteria bacterium]